MNDSAPNAEPGQPEGPESPPTQGKLLPWPPPGLQRVQGDLWLVIRRLFLAGLVLVVPLVPVVTIRQSMSSLGPFGSAWWITLVTTFLGIVLLAEATVGTVRLMRRAASALQQGYDLRTTLLVMTDDDRDNGFLVQGARVYSSLTVDQRRRLENLRVAGPLCYVTGALWLVMSFGFLVFVAARGGASPEAVAWGTLLPPVVVTLLGLVLRGMEGSMVGRARKEWYKQPWAAEIARADATEWQESAQKAGIEAVARSTARTWIFRIGAAVVAVIAVITAIPSVTLVPVSAVGATLGSMSAPWFSRTIQRAARAEGYRNLRLPADSTVTPAEAGVALNVVLRVGRNEAPPEGLLPAQRVYDEAWLPTPPEGLAWQKEDARWWTDSVWTWLERGLTAQERAYLSDVADHSALEELHRLARAPAADVVAGRFDLPLGLTWSAADLPIPRYSNMRLAAYAHIGSAAYQASQGRVADAEQTLREVVSWGFLVVEEDNWLIGSLIGIVVVDAGGRALSNLLAATGQSERAETQRLSVEAADRATTVASGAAVRPSVTAFLERLPAVVTDDEALRGLRWEHMGGIGTLAPCINLHRIVFGPGEEYGRWLAQARRSLVRYPSEDALFDVIQRGWFGTPAESPSLVGRFLSLAMGGRGEPGSCPAILDNLDEIM